MCAHNHHRIALHDICAVGTDDAARRAVRAWDGILVCLRALQKLDAMKERVRNKPMLFEEAVKDRARQAAQRQFEEGMKAKGLEDYLDEMELNP